MTGVGSGTLHSIYLFVDVFFECVRERVCRRDVTDPMAEGFTKRTLALTRQLGQEKLDGVIEALIRFKRAFRRILCSRHTCLPCATGPKIIKRH